MDHPRFKLSFDKERYTIQLPEEPIKTLKVMGHDTEIQYWFSDSSVIYVRDSETPSGINFSSMYQHDNYFERKFEADSIYLSGIADDGLIWEDRKLGEVSLGFAGVGKERLQKFRDALNSFRKRK